MVQDTNITLTENKHPNSFTPAEIAKTVTRTGTSSTENLKLYCLCGHETVKPGKNLVTCHLYFTGDGVRTSLQKSAHFSQTSWLHTRQCLYYDSNDNLNYRTANSVHVAGLVAVPTQFSVLFNDAINCSVHIVSVIDKKISMEHR